MKNNKHTFQIIASVVILVVLIYFSQTYFGDEISELITILTAIAGVIAILYQLRKDYTITKAGFIYSLNDTFSNNSEIVYIYKLLKEYRDKESIVFTEDDGRRMGDYIMYFEIMGYLLDEDMVTIQMVDKIFSNKFFLFVNNPYTQKYQLKYSRINKPILELYCTWSNYRLKTGQKELYHKHSLTKFESYIKKADNGHVELNPDMMDVGYD